MDHLWTPWRYSYVTGADTARRKGVPAGLEGWPVSHDKHCVFCNMIGAVDYAIEQGMPVEQAERAAHIVQRGPECFVCLNAYPYSTGHVLIMPYQHIDTLAPLPAAAAIEMMQTMQQFEIALRTIYQPHGLNFGLNLGQAAGAGVADHLHMHALPRWNGDTNFMTATAETRVLPEPLDVTWSKLREATRKNATSEPEKTSK
jgi:ATP adenylyltransferase